jgi:hypothetical protein
MAAPDAAWWPLPWRPMGRHDDIQDNCATIELQQPDIRIHVVEWKDAKAHEFEFTIVARGGDNLHRQIHIYDLLTLRAALLAYFYPNPQE